jgi:hypothetical protein
MGFVVCPPADMPSVRSLQEAEASVVPTVPPASRVPPSWFLTTSTVCSAQWVAGLLHPAASQGFAAFQVSPPSAPPESDGGGRGPSPRRGSHPTKISPRQQPYRITAAVAFVLLPFTAQSWGLAEAALHTHPRPTGAERETHRPGPRRRQRVGCGTGLRCDDAPIRRSGPPRHRCAADSIRPKPGAGVAQNRGWACDAEATQ